MFFPIEVLWMVFKYLKGLDLIEVSAVCKQWNLASKSARFSAKLTEVNQLFKDKGWLLKTYRHHFEAFRYEVYWEILNQLKREKVFILNREIFHRMFFSILSFRIWSHFCCCCRSQFNPDICQFCTKLQIKDKNIVNFINKKLVLDVRKLFPFDLFYTATCNNDVSLFMFSLAPIGKGLIPEIIMGRCIME